jgi:hypothetical protein
MGSIFLKDLLRTYLCEVSCLGPLLQEVSLSSKLDVNSKDLFQVVIGSHLSFLLYNKWNIQNIINKEK